MKSVSTPVDSLPGTFPEDGIEYIFYWVWGSPGGRELGTGPQLLPSRSNPAVWGLDLGQPEEDDSYNTVSEVYL